MGRLDDKAINLLISNSPSTDLTAPFYIGLQNVVEKSLNYIALFCKQRLRRVPEGRAYSNACPKNHAAFNQECIEYGVPVICHMRIKGNITGVFGERL